MTDSPTSTPTPKTTRTTLENSPAPSPSIQSNLRSRLATPPPPRFSHSRLADWPPTVANAPINVIARLAGDAGSGGILEQIQASTEQIAENTAATSLNTEYILQKLIEIELKLRQQFVQVNADSSETNSLLGRILDALKPSASRQSSQRYTARLTIHTYGTTPLSTFALATGDSDYANSITTNLAEIGYITGVTVATGFNILYQAHYASWKAAAGEDYAVCGAIPFLLDDVSQPVASYQRSFKVGEVFAVPDYVHVCHLRNSVDLSYSHTVLQLNALVTPYDQLG